MTIAWYLSEIAALLDGGFHGKIELHVQQGNIERMVKTESMIAPQVVKNGQNGKKLLNGPK